MELSELTAYAGEKFHIQEQHKWADFPGFSVLVSPTTGKWLALLMRQWDFETGAEIQRCDIKCGRQILWDQPKPYLCHPFRMKGKNWVGVAFDERTEPEVVCRLLDRAVYADGQRGYTLVLETPPAAPMVVQPDTPIPVPPAPFVADDPGIPDKIRRMMRLYDYRDTSFAGKCRNFYRQGKFMEDYTDDAPWQGAYRRYFPTYHDLTVWQLRGYFTWRTHLRKGEFLPIATSLAYLYVYELLGGIGAAGPEDVLAKLRAFEVGFLDSGIGSAGMRRNLHRWMLEYAVLHDVPPGIARQYGNSPLLQRDDALAVLRSPQEAGDDAVFEALCTLGGEKLAQSPVLTKDAARGRRLFAAVWRCAAAQYDRDGQSLFAACFGDPHTFAWYPLSNAVYWEETPHGDADYLLNPCRSYHCRGGAWQEVRYDTLYFHQDRWKGFLHETDRVLRKYLKTGHALRKRPEEAWATPYAEAAIQQEQQAAQEAARPRIHIDLSSLAQIRQDADLTRDSLLTEEETDTPAAELPALAPSAPAAAPAAASIEPADGCFAGLDATHSRILRALVQGEPIGPLLKAGHLMPSVVADTINGALLDEIGDNVLECDGNSITLVEDYREEILQYMEAEVNEQPKKIPRRIEQTILNALKGGVVPRVGLPYITVGRKNEIEALLHDVEMISEGGASFRFLVGRYGSGKSFLIQAIRNYVMDKNFIVADADLSPERRLQGTRGQGLATYRELISNLSTKTKPEGGALTLVLDRWISGVQAQAVGETGLAPGDPALARTVDQKIYTVTTAVSELVHGFEFARLLSLYYHAYLEGDDEQKARVVRWFRGEYNTKREAKEALGVSLIITDDDWYDYLKLFAVFFRMAGYAGMMFFIDELVNLYKIPNAITRQYNYEKLLAMYNDALQGKARYLGIVMGATPQAVEDKRRGLYSYEALRSRLAEGKFSRPGARDLLAPVIHLEPLSPEEMLVLCEKLAGMHANLYGYARKLSTEELADFIKMEYARIGADQNITPREVIRDFIELLDLLYQNPAMTLAALLQSDGFCYAKSEAVSDKTDRNYAEFTL